MHLFHNKTAFKKAAELDAIALYSPSVFFYVTP